MTPDAIFRMASMTKPVTTIAIMMLYEEGKLGLDDAVAKYLPGFDDLQVISAFNASDGSVQTRVAKRPMTLRHLLTHT
jgi:CubicO group peptidase (beta-lactamase class C family)